MERKILIADDDSFLPSIFSKALHQCCDFKGQVKIVENGESVGSYLYL